MIDEMYYRVAVIGLIFVSMAVSAYFRSRAAARQSERVRSSGGLMLVRITFLLALLLFVIGYAINSEWTAWSALPLSDGVRIAGGALALSAIAAFVWLFRHIGRNITPTANTLAEHQLVMTGPYRWVRHPLYTAGILFWIGMTLLSASWLLFLFVVASVVFVSVRMPREERNLEAEFGDAYRDYAAKTGRFVPRVFAR